MMTNKIAIIDMGTNTFHLLLAEANGNGQYNITHRDRVAVKIGEGGINHGYITVEGLNRALVAMQSFKNTIDDEGIQSVYAFGTSALRNAQNCSAVLEKIKTITGISCSVISGEVEANYIYQGVRYSLEMGKERSLIVDIGGGSVECIVGDNEQIFWKESFEIGAQRLMEKFQKNDPIATDEIKMLDVHFDKQLTSLFDALKRYPTSTLIGASGTFDTLSDIYCYEHAIQRHEEETETPLTLEGFYQIYEALIYKNREARMQIPGMIEMRVDMIVVATCLVRYILSRHPFNRIRVSTYSLKEGILASFIQKQKSHATSTGH